MCIYGVFVFLLVACYQDYREGKIRNWLICAGLIWGICQQCVLNGQAGVLDFAEGLLGVLLITYPLFKLGMIGAGDVKLFAVCAGSLGIKRGMIFLGCTFLTAAIISLIKMFYHRNFLQRFRYFFRYVEQSVAAKQLFLYGTEGDKEPEIHIPLAGPACLSILLCLGGLY